MGRDAAFHRQAPPGAVHFSGNEGPDLCGERPQLLDAQPAVSDRFKGGRRQWPLAAVVELGLVGQRRTLQPDLSGLIAAHALVQRHWLCLFRQGRTPVKGLAPAWRSCAVISLI